MIEATVFKIRYELTGPGWAACHVSVNDQTTTATASYLSDALGELITAVLLLKKSGYTPDAIFAEEPGQFRWAMEYHNEENSNRDRVHLRLYFDEEWIGSPRKRHADLGCERLNALIPTNLFFQAFCDMLDDILTTYGTHGYEEEWNSETKTMAFPSAEHNELKSVL
jgi:hypothetical protein